MSTAEKPSITHPVWCDPARCTAPTQPPGDYDPVAYGTHRSDLVVGNWGGVAFLTQAAAPWETDVYLRVEHPASAVDSFVLTPDSPLLLLLRRHAADQEARFPSLVPPLDGAAQ
jgi:hypothetical protein